jgi:hypothetical protein
VSNMATQSVILNAVKDLQYRFSPGAVAENLSAKTAQSYHKCGIDRD